MNRIAGLTSAAALLASIIIANWLTTRYGFVPVGFGLASTAGTFIAGFALALRDSTQDLLGKKWMLATIAVGALISYLIADPFIATASAAAFLIAELIDFTIYTPLRKKSKLGDRRWAAAVIASNVGSAIADTVVFLAIAFGWAAVLPAMAGQLVGKAWATVLYLIVGKAVSARGSVLRESDVIEAGA
jgi:uncharacterized PurR-regulated membrane protein YhhQ (DUF165 family)